VEDETPNERLRKLAAAGGKGFAGRMAQAGARCRPGKTGAVRKALAKVGGRSAAGGSTPRPGAHRRRPTKDAEAEKEARATQAALGMLARDLPHDLQGAEPLDEDRLSQRLTQMSAAELTRLAKLVALARGRGGEPPLQAVAQRLADQGITLEINGANPVVNITLGKPSENRQPAAAGPPDRQDARRYRSSFQRFSLGRQLAKVKFFIEGR
jgi:hypothetical protein